MTKPHRLRALALLALALGACRTTGPDDLESVYYAALADYTRDDGTGALRGDVLARQDERLAIARALAAEGALKTPEHYLFAAAILVTGDRIEDLLQAHELALRAAELGDDRGLPVAAEAVDKVALKHRIPQRYGTQYVFEPVLERWSLYQIDPRTTDAERQAMGVPPLAELLARVDQLNEGPLAERISPPPE